MKIKNSRENHCSETSFLITRAIYTSNYIKLLNFAFVAFISKLKLIDDFAAYKN